MQQSRKFLHLHRASLLGLVFIAALLASCSEDDPGPVPPVTPPETEIEARVLSLINQHRAGKGLSALVSNEVVVKEARAHSGNMANNVVGFGHDGFQQRVQNIGENITVTGAGENVAFNFGFADPASQAVTGWLNSTGHRQNIEGNYDLTGIGVVKNSSGTLYFTQIFVKSR